MSGPNWSDDDPADATRILANIGVVAILAHDLGVARATLTEADLQDWHRRIYDGCNVPSADYVGRFRGEPAPDVVDYEVGIGPIQPDGMRLRVGVWASDVSAATATFFASLNTALTILDTAIASGARPTTADHLDEVVGVAAEAHGEWVRIHPFVNGNGRTARLLVAHIAIRYGLPVFVDLKPRPHDVAYARVAATSMGRPPDFIGDHGPARATFSHLLTLHVLGP